MTELAWRVHSEKRANNRQRSAQRKGHRAGFLCELRLTEIFSSQRVDKTSPSKHFLPNFLFKNKGKLFLGYSSVEYELSDLLVSAHQIQITDREDDDWD